MEINNSPVASRKASSTSRVDRPRAYISLTSDSNTSLLPSREPHQERAERLAGAADLRHRHIDEPLRGAQPAPLIAVPGPGLVLAAAVVAAPAAEEVVLLTLQQLLHHQPGHRLHQRGDDVGLAVDTADQQLLQLLASDHGRGYPSHRPAPSSSVLNTRHDRAGHLDLQER